MGASTFSKSAGGHDWLKPSYELFIAMSGNCERDFRIGRPSNSERECFNTAPAVWSCADKMETTLLRTAKHPDGLGIMPHSLKATKISAVTAEVAKGNGDSPPHAAQWGLPYLV